MKAIWMLLLVLLAGSLLVAAQETIPAGTVLPVTLTKTLRSENTKPGDLVTARLAQSVPLSPGQVLRAGSKVNGHVAEVSGTKLALVFDSIEVAGKPVSITTNLRALASSVMVADAQLPINGPDKGTPASAWTTVQVGGDVVYRGGGPVASGSENVGEPVDGGVLDRVSAQPGSKCRGELAGNSTPQALWVFSSDACGVYGYNDVAIVHGGRSEPIGEMILSSNHSPIKLGAGTGLLLRVGGNESRSASAKTNP